MWQAGWEEGNYRGAIRLACGSDIIAEHSPTTLESLRKKHPSPHPSPAHADRFSASITAEALRRAIVSEELSFLSQMALLVVQMGLVLGTLRTLQTPLPMKMVRYS